MKEFALLFRNQVSFDNSKLSPTEMEALALKWKNWIENLKSGEHFMGNNVLSTDGKVLRPGGVVTDGPFVELKERLGGLIILKAANLEEATTLAHGCPILELGGNVEIRPVLK